MSGRKWTDEEVRYLEKNWVRMGPVRIGEALGRTRISVLAKARSYGLGRRVDGGGELMPVGMIIRAFGKQLCSHYAAECFEKQGLSVIRFGQMRVMRYSVRTDDFWPWLRAHQRLWPVARLAPLSLGPEPDWVEPMRRASRKYSLRHSRKIWTNQEDMLLSSLVHQRIPIAEISSRMYRSEAAIYKRTEILGLDVGYSADSTRRKWTEEDLAAVERLILSGASVTEVCHRIGRSEHSTRIKMKKVYGTSITDKITDILRGGDGHAGKRTA